jgi:hypothetical protein
MLSQVALGLLVERQAGEGLGLSINHKNNPPTAIVARNKRFPGKR